MRVLFFPNCQRRDFTIRSHIGLLLNFFQRYFITVYISSNKTNRWYKLVLVNSIGFIYLNSLTAFFAPVPAAVDLWRDFIFIFKKRTFCHIIYARIALYIPENRNMHISYYSSRYISCPIIIPLESVPCPIFLVTTIGKSCPTVLFTSVSMVGI